ncbi:Matrix metalloproteinase-20 [Larimichthys crocea]|uniref:Matrix metalloproteinase-14 n=1 Tax=Larimichthys crocea TaxID=215358 RepID=A0A6G0IWA0_LARCR|nr:Matrix metalloproteinase-20 [Larimichthys crocea]
MPGPCFTAPTFMPEALSSPSTEPQVDLKLATGYLQQYYNLQIEPMGRMKRSGPSFTSKVKDMQIFFGLNVTGTLDSDTLEVMSSPRCGVPDVEEYSDIQGTRWNKNVITYSIGRYTRDLPRTTVDSLVESAFNVWARASSLTFVRSHTRSADIMVEFVTNGPLRGRPNYFSRYGWNSQSNQWLSGSMFPRLLQNKCDPDLTFDAVSTLGDATFFFRERYLWIKHNEQYDIKEGPITNFMPKIETNIDAAFWVPRRSTAYIIHESMFWTVKGSRVKGKPRALTHFGFPAWVQDVDAAVHIVKTGRTLFFMHDIYWSYNENRRVMDFGYPKYISEDFPGVNTTINAALHKEGFIYFFVGPQVYKYDYTQKHVVGVEKANSWLGC